MQIGMHVTRRGKGFAAIGREAAKRLSQIVRKTCLDVEAEAKQTIMTGPKTGRVYVRSANVSHQASAPGEAPATDLGHLVNAVTPYRRVSEYEGEVQWHAAYAAGLEFGTRKVAPRPFVRPAMAKVKPSFEKAIKVALREAGR